MACGNWTQAHLTANSILNFDVLIQNPSMSKGRKAGSLDPKAHELSAQNTAVHEGDSCFDSLSWLQELVATFKQSTMRLQPLGLALR